jgi:hypothetical protein
MAITRTQIAKQLLALGGRIGFQGGGRDAASDDFGGPSENTGGEDRGRDPMAQFSSGPPSAKGRQGVEDMRAELRSAISAQNRSNFFQNLIKNPVFQSAVYAANPILGGKISARNVMTGINAAKNLRNMVNNPLANPNMLSEEEEEEKDKNNPEDVSLGTGLAEQAKQDIIENKEANEAALSALEEELGIGKADGGRIGLMGGGMPYEGGIMDFESARQMYGLGKLVRKVTRTVKKITKSPVGKAALLYTGAAGLGALGAGTGFAGFKANFMSPTTLFGSLKKTGQNLGLLKRAIGTSDGPGMLMERIGPLSKLGVGSLITGASLLAGGLTAEQEEEAQQISDETGIPIETIRANPNEYLARRFRAEGGSMKEPVAKKTMPLLDMDGQEMDLRAEGGFVPIGRMEKADDVPARLSKNEFVFTADAVRNAGDGNVDKGAEVMYNMMKNLESGGDVSEESQGLEGARKMFQTSQRLEEVL